jgi:hypothetical protein
METLVHGNVISLLALVQNLASRIGNTALSTLLIVEFGVEYCIHLVVL